MQKNSITPTPVNKIKIVLTKKKMTVYGGFALIAAFFRQIGFAQMIEHALPIIESSPNGMGIHGKGHRLCRYGLCRWSSRAQAQ